MQELFTLKEVSEKLKIAEETLRKYLRNKKLEGVKIGRHWRCTEQNINDFLEKYSK